MIREIKRWDVDCDGGVGKRWHEKCHNREVVYGVEFRLPLQWSTAEIVTQPMPGVKEKLMLTFCPECTDERSRIAASLARL